MYLILDNRDKKMKPGGAKIANWQRKYMMLADKEALAGVLNSKNLKDTYVISDIEGKIQWDWYANNTWTPK